MILVEEKDKRFYLAESSIPNAGTGVFAKQFLKKGEIIEIVGVQVKSGSMADRCTDFAYRFKFSASDKSLDRYVVPMGWAGMINHSFENNNAIIRCMNSRNKDNSNSGQMVYFVIKDIKKDEEVIGNYGEEWDEVFQFIDKNNKTDWEVFLEFGLYGLQECWTIDS